jgi:D-alanyl-D-alanine dipeptidase
MFRWWPCLLLQLLFTHGVSAQQLPPEFVNLRDVAPDILQDIRYAGPDNFTGQKVPGYDASECVLKRPVAEKAFLAGAPIGMPVAR